MRLRIGWIVLLATLCSGAQTTADGLDHFYNLEYPAAIAEFQQVADTYPASAAAWNHLAQAELYQEMYRIGALQSQLYGPGDPFLAEKLLTPTAAEDAAFLDANQKALVVAQGAVARSSADAHAHYDLAVAWGLHGNWEFSVHKGYWAALGDAKNARREAELALKLDPSLEDAKLIVGVQSYVAGSLPWTVRMFSKLVGYSGNKEQGRALVAEVASHGVNAGTDAAVLLAVMDRRDGRNTQAAPIFAHLSGEYPRNVLFAVETGEAEDAAGQHEAARAQFAAVVARADAHASGYDHAPLGEVWYDLGEIDDLYSRWPQAASDFDQVLRQTDVRPEMKQEAEKAEQQARQHLN